MTRYCVHGTQVKHREKWAGQEIMSTETSLWSWGANSYGQLAQGNQEDQLLPVKVKDTELKIKSITGGGGHTMVITDKNDLWVCGSNNKGQLGLGNTNDVSCLTLVGAFKTLDETVTMVAGGWDFSLAVTSSGKLYCWGSNTFGQLGNPQLPDKCLTPAQVQINEGDCVIQVAAGLRHSVALTESGDVYCWGHAKKGQCGNLGEGKPQLKCPNPFKVPLQEKIKSITAGSHHTAALTENGHVIIWGCNKYGQSTQDPAVTPTVNDPYTLPVELFNCTRIHSLRSGWTHLMAQNDCGELYSWGRCDYGQLGRSRSTGQHLCSKPGKLAIPHNVIQYVCGSEHSLFLTDDHRVAAVGWNEHGLCGTGDEENVEEIRPIETLADKSAILIGCGGGHCFTVTKDIMDGDKG